MSTQYITSIGLNYNVWDFTWRVSDCEELVGGSHRRWCGWFRRIQHISSIGEFFNNGGFESESRN